MNLMQYITPTLVLPIVVLAAMFCLLSYYRHAMSPREADELIGQLLELENPYACPHGRPTIISMSKYELEKKFKRIV